MLYAEQTKQQIKEQENCEIIDGSWNSEENKLVCLPT